jgi:ATP-binding cassette subfamily F protein uup
MPVVTLDHVSMAYGHLPLLADASLQVEPRERVCVIGRNGTGKSTLLQIISGDLPPEGGSVWRQPGLRIGRLAQDVPLSDPRPVFDIVSEGLGDLGDLVAAYHHAAVQVAEGMAGGALETLGRLQHELEERDGWRLEQRVETVLARLGLPADASVQTLSGGWRRRVLLSRALVGQPDLLLLDEPTNHLDIETMTWLETLLVDYPGAVVFVTHDRVFLQRVATRIVELDRGLLTSWPGDYETFVTKKEEWLANEAARNEKFDKRLAEEEAWLRQGIKARRTRNEGRVRALVAMRAERADRRTRIGAVRLQVDIAERSGQVVFDADHVTKGFGGAPVVRDVSVRVMRGDRIGLIGPNGSGKTTLLRLLMGDLAPDAGEVRRGAGVQIVHYDQQREQLDPDRTVFDTIGDGNDMVIVNGQSQHVLGYLKQFLFPPERASSPVRALSGGERNRLLLARLFTRPANVLVLDEPTNDLDIETLELLEALLIDWPGTLLLVSHDRAFIDNVVTSTVVFEGGGQVQEYVGGYEDWMRQRPEPQPGLAVPAGGGGVLSASAKAAADRRNVKRGALLDPAVPHASGAAKKLTYREQQELKDLPARIEALEVEQQVLNAKVEAANFYKESGVAIKEALARVVSLQEQLLQAYARWDELESRAR